MWPLLENGDEIFISNIENINKGDIITVHNTYGRILTHRVIDDLNLITKGDNNVFPEKPLDGSAYKLLGKLEYIIREGQKVYINNMGYVIITRKCLSLWDELSQGSDGVRKNVWNRAKLY